MNYVENLENGVIIGTSYPGTLPKTKFYICKAFSPECHIYLWPDKTWKYGAWKSEYNNAYYNTIEEAKAILAASPEPPSVPPERI